MSKLRPLVLSGPSGCGKSTLIKKLMSEYANMFSFCVSHTTRQPRPGEVNGEHYHFTDKQSMENKIKNGDFIESAIFNNNIYGTSKQAVKDVIAAGKICMMDIDSQGVKSIKNTDLNCILIFVKPPSIEELERRLRSRGTETEESLTKRLATSKSEFEYAAQPGIFHYTITNDNLEKAYTELKEIINKEMQLFQ